MRSRRRRLDVIDLARMKGAAVGLLVIGLAQMTGDVTGVRLLKAIGAATGASPAPKVFSAVQGLETYSTQFFIEWTEEAGGERSVELTPEVYRRLRGPYNRRNVYGAALAYGPVLAANDRTRPMFEAVAAHALCGGAPLLHELGIPAAPRPGTLRVRYVPATAGAMPGLPRSLTPSCR